MLKKDMAYTSMRWCQACSKSVLNLPVSKNSIMWRFGRIWYTKKHMMLLCAREVLYLLHISWEIPCMLSLVGWTDNQTETSNKYILPTLEHPTSSRKLVQQHFIGYSWWIWQTELVFKKAKLRVFTMPSGGRPFITFCLALTHYLLLQKGKWIMFCKINVLFKKRQCKVKTRVMGNCWKFLPKLQIKEQQCMALQIQL